jgi:hypothetical protein
MTNQHGGNGGLELLGGSQVIGPDGVVRAAAPRGPAAAGECSYLVYRVPLRESLRQARAESGPLLSGRRPELYRLP